MAKKKAQKKKKQVTRAKSTPQKTVKSTAQKAPKKPAKTEKVEASNYIESDSNAAPATDRSQAGSDWDWKAWAVLGLAAAIILFSGWLVVRSLGSFGSQTLNGSASSPVPIEGAANPEQLQAGGDTNVQNGTAPQGENSSNGSGLQEQSPVTPEQLNKLQ